MQDALGAATSTDEASFSTAKARSPSVHDQCKAAYKGSQRPEAP